jgi:hypothetical protein
MASVIAPAVRQRGRHHSKIVLALAGAVSSPAPSAASKAISLIALRAVAGRQATSGWAAT